MNATTECVRLYKNCPCQPRCKVCGFGMHDAIHLPPLNSKTDEPWGHRFEPKNYFPKSYGIGGSDE